MDDEFDTRLQERLAAIEDPAYADPARPNLPTLDVVLLVVCSVLLLALMWFLGAPA